MAVLKRLQDLKLNLTLVVQEEQPGHKEQPVQLVQLELLVHKAFKEMQDQLDTLVLGVLLVLVELQDQMAILAHKAQLGPLVQPVQVV